MVSGRIHVTTGTFTPRPSLLADLSLSLRLPLDELALPRRCTPWHVIPNVRHKHFCPCRSITLRFQALLTPCHGFFSTFPHGTYCAIGLETYLRLEVRDPRLPAPFPGSSTQDTSTTCQFVATGLSPCVAARSSALCVCQRGLKGSPYPTSQTTFIA